MTPTIQTPLAEGACPLRNGQTAHDRPIVVGQIGGQYHATKSRACLSPSFSYYSSSTLLADAIIARSVGTVGK